MRRLAKWLANIMLGLLVLLVVLFVLLPAVFASSLAVVYSGSMAPAMPVGALAVMERVDPAKIKVGDIIAFRPRWDPDVTVSHRVVEVRANGDLYFLTKGDATEEYDPFLIPPERVQGKVIFNIPYLGYAANSMLDFVKTRLGLVFFICVPSLIIFGITIRDVSRYRSLRGRRLKNRQKRQQRWRR